MGQSGNPGQVWRRRELDGDSYPWPPVLGGAPVSPSPMARVVVVKALEEVRREGRASLVKVVRSILRGIWRVVSYKSN